MRRSGRGAARRASRRGRLAVVLVACAAAAAGCTGGGAVIPAGATAATRPAPGAPGTPTVAPTLPSDLGAAAVATCSPDLSPGWLARENARAGVVPVPAAASDGSDHLYLDAVSAVCGQVVRVAVSARPGLYHLRVVRTGWYGGSGGRVLADGPDFVAGRPLDAPGARSARSPAWPSSELVRVAPGWVPGVYLVQLVSGTRIVSASPLIVRAPAQAPRSPVLFVASAMTWTAYTTFGGRSLYRDLSLRGVAARDARARVSDFARPTEGAGGSGLYRYTTPLVRAVERAGVDVDYAADVDVDRTPSLVTSRAELVTGAHTEYVTRRMYDAFEAARDAGTNLAFLGGNGFYWQARVQRDQAGNPLSMTVYRDAVEDPLARTAPDLATVRWRSYPVLRPEAGLLGAQYSGLGLVTPLVVLDPPQWLGWTRGTILAAGAASEVDALVPGISPAGTQVIAAGAGTVHGHEISATVTYYVAVSGAAVFDASNVFVACSTDDSCGAVHVPVATGRSWLDAIGRVVTAFSTPRFGREHPAVGGAVVPSAEQLVARYGPAARGFPIPGDD